MNTLTLWTAHEIAVMVRSSISNFYIFTMNGIEKQNKSSHAHTVVWECCKDDRQSQWEMAKFDPQPTLNP